MGLFSNNSSYLGVDIGSSGIKMVELKKEGRNLRLLTYAFSEPAQEIDEGEWQKDSKYVAAVINKMRDDSNVKSSSAVAALPTFSVFSSIINLSNVDKKDLESAVKWEAKKVIPLPIEEMVLDWKEVDEASKDKSAKVLLTGAPKNLVKSYVDIFKAAKINLLSLETETFSLVRSLMGNDKTNAMIVEIGSGTTDISIVSKSIPVLTRSIDVGGLTITKQVSKNLNISLERAEQFKYDLGVNNRGDSVIPKAISQAIDPVVNEIKYVTSLFENKHKEKIEKIIISGGSAMLPNLTEYLSKVLDINVIIGDPWARISYPLDLEPVLKEIGPRMSVAIGLAMRGAE